MSNKLIFTVTNSENDKPIIHAQIVPAAYKRKQEAVEALIRDWLEANDLPEATVEELEDLAHQLRKEGYAWWEEIICFELTGITDVE